MIQSQLSKTIISQPSEVVFRGRGDSGLEHRALGRTPRACRSQPDRRQTPLCTVTSAWLPWTPTRRELLGVHKSHVVQTGPRSPAVISLGLTKGGKRAGASESITIREEETLRRLWQWLNTPTTPSCLCGTPQSWRKTFDDTLQACNLESYDFRPYSLRRGGATMYFGRHRYLDRLLVQGRFGKNRSDIHQ